MLQSCWLLVHFAATLVPLCPCGQCVMALSQVPDYPTLAKSIEPHVSGSIMAAEETEVASAKWDAYFGKDKPEPPWERAENAPNSQVLRFLDKISELQRESASAPGISAPLVVADLGCGGGNNAAAIAKFRPSDRAAEASASVPFSAVGVDFSRNALEVCEERWAGLFDSKKLEVRHADLSLDLAVWAQKQCESELRADAAVDVQTWHAVRGQFGADSSEAKAYVANVADILLRPSSGSGNPTAAASAGVGLFLLVCGNANDKSNDAAGRRGPNAVTEEEIRSAWEGPGLFEILEMREGRFDKTKHYGREPPLCWEVVMRVVRPAPKPNESDASNG